MTFVMIGGGFDLSVGAIFALGAVVFASLADPIGLWAAGAVVLLVAAACGVINGFIVTKLKVNPFVATLGTGSAFGGLAYIYSRSAPVTPNNIDYQVLGTERWLGWPISIWIMIVAFVVGEFVLAKTVYGQSIYAIGGNTEAAKLSGLRVDLLRGSTYVLSAVCSGLGGMILSSRLAVGQADMGSTIALDAIAIVVIGGTSLLGGEGAIWRTAIGLLIIAILTNIFGLAGSQHQLPARREGNDRRRRGRMGPIRQVASDMNGPHGSSRRLACCSSALTGPNHSERGGAHAGYVAPSSARYRR